MSTSLEAGSAKLGICYTYFYLIWFLLYEAQYEKSKGGPLLTLFFETLEKQPCKPRSDLGLNGQMRVV